ncbi:XERICO [Symbiodinium sp. CCMP2592]|nr:XERICO [Symbiodinium sp. CCMP2592]
MEFSFPSLISLFFISLCLVSKLVVCLQCYLSRLQERDVISLATAPQPDPLDLETEKCGISEACRVWASGKITSPEPRMLEFHRILVNGTEVNWSKVGQPEHKQAVPRTQADTQPCACCLDDFHADSQVAFLPCGHMFHEPCIARWSVSGSVGTGNTTCPVCRTPFHAEV